MKAALGNHTTSLIHDGNDEIDDMEDTNDVIPINEEKTLASLVYVTSNFVATNNKGFKMLKDMVNFYLQYKKNPRNTM